MLGREHVRQDFFLIGTRRLLNLWRPLAEAKAALLRVEHLYRALDELVAAGILPTGDELPWLDMERVLERGIEVVLRSRSGATPVPRGVPCSTLGR